MAVYGGRISEVVAAGGGNPTPGGSTYGGAESELAAHAAPPAANVVLLLHMNNTGTPGTYIDSSPSAHTMTARDGCEQSAGAAKFGAGGTSFGASDSVDTPSHADFNFGTAQFSIDCWAYHVPTSTYSAGSITFPLVRKGTEYQLAIEEEWDTELEEYVGAFVTLDLDGGRKCTSGYISDSTYLHIAAWRYDGNVYLTIGGVIADSAASSETLSDSNILNIGPDNAYVNLIKMDELRICNTTIDYTDSNFTPETGEYT